MATTVPELSEAQLDALQSQGEAAVYRALRDSLPDEYTVLFQVGWIQRRARDRARDGETDFLICHPDHGYVCVEVKGGGIGFDAEVGRWFSVDRHGRRHGIRDPVGQARGAKYSIHAKLDEHRRWRAAVKGEVLRGHAVFFPDVGGVDAVSRPDLPAVLIGCSRDLEQACEWVEGVFAYWERDARHAVPLGRRGIEVMRKVFARSFEVAPLTRPRVGSRLAAQEKRRLKLTRDQMRLLDYIRSHRRVAVCGGAGTGKTVLAVEKARRLAGDGFRTLLTCYNRQLADHLARVCAGTDNLEVMSFHQLCHRQVARADSASGRELLSEAKVTYPGRDLFDVQLPNALAYSVDVLPERYEAIICDEGQDFREEYWVPLELLLEDFEESPLYVFFDDNQNLYSRASTFPIMAEPHSLTTNCRNTVQIHEAAYARYRGAPVSPPDNEGPEVVFERARNVSEQAKRIGARVVDLVAGEQVSPGDIVVLVADAPKKADHYGLLRRLPIPRPARWLEEGVRGKDTVLMETVARFKGLEAAVVILWGLDGVEWARSEELLYVGISRAKSLLVVVGSGPTCASVERGLADRGTDGVGSRAG